MKNKSIILLVAMLATLSGCKKNDWLDWKAQNELWLERNKQTIILPFENTEGKVYKIETTASGVQYIIVDDPNPTDARPNTASTVSCNYTLDLINTIDNKSYHVDASPRSDFMVSEVVPGFAEGIKKIHNHGHILIYVPYFQGYGKKGMGTNGGTGYIPPYSTLIFDVTLNDVY